MTVIIKQRKIDDYTVTVSISGGERYQTLLTWNGVKIRSNYYGTVKEATRCYYRYCAVAKRGEA